MQELNNYAKLRSFFFGKLHLVLLFILLSVCLTPGFAQKPKEGMIRYLDNDSIRYIKGTAIAQIWTRYNFNNPGSTVFGTPQEETFDVGIRRARYQVMAQLNPKVFFYTQIGINSFNSISARKTPIFFHDVTGEYTVAKEYLTIGAGLHGYNGTARYTSSGIGNILGLELPIIQETTNDINDQFVRKLGVYAKGKIKSFDYRLSLSNPFPVQNALSPIASIDTSKRNISYYSSEVPQLQSNGYFMWQFLDKESNQLPYMTGSYLGKKTIFNIGVGFAHQPEAMWHRNENGDTVRTPLQQFGADIFVELPFSKEKQNCVTIYASYLKYDFGPNYIRNSGPMNMANGVKGQSSFNGPGNAIPLTGTGDVIYFQIGYLFRKNLLGSQGTLQPFFQRNYCNYERMNGSMSVYDIGINWLQAGNNSKISLEYQDRPIFGTQSGDKLTEINRKGCIIMQYQLMF